MIANCGKDMSQLKTREEVHKEYGEPIASGIEKDKRYEDFHSHRKVVDEEEASDVSMAIGMTFGLGEFVYFPVETYRAMRATVFGQDLRFYYGSSGNVEDVKLNGRTMVFNRKDRQTWSEAFVDRKP